MAGGGGGGWSSSAPIRNDHMKFVGVRKHSWGVLKHYLGFVKFRNMLPKFARKAYSQHIKKRLDGMI